MFLYLLQALNAEDAEGAEKVRNERGAHDFHVRGAVDIPAAIVLINNPSMIVSAYSASSAL
jgi:hypothetical protein